MSSHLNPNQNPHQQVLKKNKEKAPLLVTVGFIVADGVFMIGVLTLKISDMFYELMELTGNKLPLISFLTFFLLAAVTGIILSHLGYKQMKAVGYKNMVLTVISLIIGYSQSIALITYILFVLSLNK